MVTVSVCRTWATGAKVSKLGGGGGRNNYLHKMFGIMTIEFLDFSPFTWFQWSWLANFLVLLLMYSMSECAHSNDILMRGIQRVFMQRLVDGAAASEPLIRQVSSRVWKPYGIIQFLLIQFIFSLSWRTESQR
jgi:hypothetical protein